MNKQNTSAPHNSISLSLFKAAPEEHQKLVRAILADERKVHHLRTRPGIHQKIYDHVKRIIQ